MMQIAERKLEALEDGGEMVVDESTRELLFDQGKLLAESLYRCALKESQDILGSTHDTTLTLTQNLHICWKTNKACRGGTADSRALAGRKETLGLTHPSTLTCVLTLAYLLQDQGKLKGGTIASTCTDNKGRNVRNN